MTKKFANKFSGFLVVLAGPTGVGETTVTKMLLKRLPRAQRLVTTTTRPRRPGEREGREYHFVAKADFQRDLRKGLFLEHIYVRNRGVYYGSHRQKIESVLRQGKILIANLELRGLRFMRKHYPSTLAIFIAPESIGQIRAQKLKQHPTITKIELARRLANARAEIREAKYYDRVVVNRQRHIIETVEKICALIRAHAKKVSAS